MLFGVTISDIFSVGAAGVYTLDILIGAIFLILFPSNQ